MTTPEAASTPEVDVFESAPASEESAWRRAPAVAAGAGWLIAALVPLDGVLHGLALALGCLVAVAAVRAIGSRVHPSLAMSAASVLAIAAGATAFVRFAVPAIESDSPLVRIASFVAFAAIYVGYLAVSSRASGMSTPIEERPEYEYRFWRTQAFVVAHTGVLLSALYLLARVFSPTLVLLLVAAEFVSTMTTLLARRYLGSAKAADRQILWNANESFAKHPVFATSSLVIPMFVGFAYPVAAGIVYFTHTVPSDDLTVWVFRLTLVALFFSGLPIAIFMLVATLSSPNVSEKLRVRQLVMALGSLLNVGVLLSLFLWSFDLAGSETEVGAASQALTFSPQVVGTLLAYFFLAILVPYAIGTLRSRRQALRLAGVYPRALERLVAALERPHTAHLRVALADVKSSLEEIERESMRENLVLALAEEGDDLPSSLREALPSRFANGLPPTQKLAYDHMRADQRSLMKADDPRLRFWAHLRTMRAMIDEIDYTLEHLSTGDATLRREWAEFLDKRRQEVVRHIAERPRTRLPAWLTVGGIVAPVVSVVLDQFGNWVWAQLVASLPG